MTWLVQQAEQLGVAKLHRDRQLILEKGTAASHAFYLRSGAVEVMHHSAAGSSVVVKILAAPNLFGVIEQLGDEPTYLESARALGPVSVRSVPRTPFLELLRASPQVCFGVLENTAAAFCMAARFETAHLTSPEEKLANYVLALFDVAGEPTRTGVRLSLKRTQLDFAEAIGASERSVSRMLTKWQDDGLIDKRNGRYQLYQRAQLVSKAGLLHGSLVLHGPTGLVDARGNRAS